MASTSNTRLLYTCEFITIMLTIELVQDVIVSSEMEIETLVTVEVGQEPLEVFNTGHEEMAVVIVGSIKELVIKDELRNEVLVENDVAMQKQVEGVGGCWVLEIFGEVEREAMLSVSLTV